jgi:hypothetical protein
MSDEPQYPQLGINIEQSGAMLVLISDQVIYNTVITLGKWRVS